MKIKKLKKISTFENGEVKTIGEQINLLKKQFEIIFNKKI